MRSLIIFIVFFLPLSVTAQKTGYFADLVSGEVWVSKSNKKTVQLIPRSQLSPDDIIIIKMDNVKVTIGKVGKETEYLEINKKGNYKVAELFKSQLHRASGIMEKYIHFLWKHLIYPGKDLGQLNSTDLGSWGGVIRAGCSLGKYPYNGLVFSTDKIIFRWKHVNEEYEYKITITGNDKNELLQLSVRDTQLVINSRFFLHDPKKIFYWSVNTSDERCKSVPEYKFTVLPKEEYQKQVKEILKTINEPDKISFDLKAAELLDQKGFYEEACEYLKKAVLEKR